MTGTRRWARHLHIECALVLSVALAVAGCAAVQQTLGGWFGSTPTPPPSPETPSQTPERAGAAGVFYSGAEGLNVYSEASASSKLVGELPLYDKVDRSKLERGWAYVTSATSGVTGWVDNAQLLWRVPSTPSAPAAQATPEEAVTPVVPAPTPTGSAPPGGQPGAPPSPQPTPMAPSRGIAPSIFDAY